MNVYLDDDLDSNALIGLLRKLGHRVVSPRATATRGASDGQHLRFAADNGLVLLTANAGDFIELHDEWAASGREHSGIAIVYRENNPARDMTFREVALAVTNLDRSCIALANDYHNLNFWR